MEKWIKINYDHVPKYCKSCRIRGHNEEECYVIHLKLYPKKEIEGERMIKETKRTNTKVTKRWVDEVFMENKKDENCESMSERVKEDKETATQGGDIDEGSRSDIAGNKGKEK
ncbi:hypothetical protein H5410_032425 [Solanum commersonii]|uniref:Uncharacterized protein n=1 Tax=Solanum commersonii TaxID=4109 RepID=A0A9J5YMU6_SOLCO|nr:hypothetical protein H5410_032425 [Solanum commersonii]